MVNATQAAAETARPAALSGQGSGRLLGYVIACVVPAVFWTLLYAAAGMDVRLLRFRGPGAAVRRRIWRIRRLSSRPSCSSAVTVNSSRASTHLRPGPPAHHLLAAPCGIADLAARRHEPALAAAVGRQAAAIRPTLGEIAGQQCLTVALRAQRAAEPHNADAPRSAMTKIIRRASPRMIDGSGTIAFQGQCPPISNARQ